MASEEFEENQEDYGQELLSWQIPEYEKHERGLKWYIIAGVLAVAFIIYGLWTSNYLFALLVVMFAAITMINHWREPVMLDFVISAEGVVIGDKFFDYDTIKHFSLIYKPKEQVKTLYLEFKSVLRPRLSIPLFNVNPVLVRQHLLKYIMEDVDRTDESNSDFISKKLKL